MAGAHGWVNIRQALSNPNYRLFQIGRFSSQITLWMYRLSIGWIVWQMTGSAAWLGVFGVLDQAPTFLIAPFAGVMADRLNPVKYMRVTQALMAVQAVALSLMLIFDFINIWSLAAFTLAYGTVVAFQQPVGQSIMPLLIAREHLTAGYGLNSLSFNSSRFIGPMLAGLVINAWGPGEAIFCNALGAIGFSICLASMRLEKEYAHEQAGRAAKETKPRVLQDLRDGFLYATRHPGLAPAMIMLSVLSVLVFSIDQLLPSIADGVFREGAQGLAWMTSARAAGSIVNGTLLARRAAIRGLTAYVTRAILVSAVAFGVLAFSQWFWLAMLCAFFIGYSSTATRSGSMTLMQYSVDPQMRGRVASFYIMISQGGPSVGAFLIGALGDRFGIQAVMGFIGICSLLLWLWTFSRRKAIGAALEVETRT